MKSVHFLLLFLIVTSSHSAQFVPLSAGQREALEISATPVEPVKQVWGNAYPAKVRVPNDQLMVVTAPQKGLITRLVVAEGEQVEKGALLAMIQSPGLVEEQRLYLQAVTRLGLSRAELNRDRQLRDEGIIAERRLLETQARFTQVKTETEQRRQALSLAGMGQSAIRKLENKHTLSAMLEVRAPMAGVILAQLATPGQRVDIASPIYRIGELDPLWLEIQVPLEKLAGVKPGTDVKVAKPEARGKVVTIGSMIQGENQSILVRAEIPNDQGHLRPGQFVEARLAQVGGQRVWRIPRQALLRVGGKTWVLVERDKGFEPVAVSLIGEEHDTLVIKGELQSGDHVAVSGTAALKAAWLEGEG